MKFPRVPIPVAILLIGVAFIALWQAASVLEWTDSTVLPAFSDVVAAAAKMLVDATFLANAADTAGRIATAFVIGAPLALGFGLFAGERIKIQRVINPLFNLIMSMPQSIFLPIYIFVLGIGFAQKVVYGITHVIFVVAVTAMAAVAQVPRSYVLASRSFGCSDWQIYRKIYLPAMAPVIVTGLRIGLIFNIIGVLLAEMYASRTGLGVLIFRWGEAYDTRRAMAVILLVSCITILVNEAMLLCEARVGRWKREMDRHG